MANLELTNMVMIQNLDTGEVMVQERIKSWCGIPFPGGHAENGEPIYDSVLLCKKALIGSELSCSIYAIMKLLSGKQLYVLPQPLVRAFFRILPGSSYRYIP